MIRLRRGFHLCQGYDVTRRRDRRWRIDCGLSSRWARCDAENFFDRGRIVNLSALDHGGDVAGVANVLRRVAIDEDQVGQFSGGWLD
jgi:hypothetical protein